jgi:hypothetical protein
VQQAAQEAIRQIETGYRGIPETPKEEPATAAAPETAAPETPPRG